MTASWPAFCTAVALVLLLVLIIRFKLHAFIALLVVSLLLGLAAGLPPEKVMDSIGKGVGEIMTGVAVILALGAILGRLLDASGAAEVIARTLLQAFGVSRASLAILVAAYLIGIPVLFNVGFLLLIPIMWRLQRETGHSLLWFVLPLSFSLGVTHSLVPPHPGIVGAVQALGGAEPGTVMIETILFGTLMGIPEVLVGWFGPGRWWARRYHVSVPGMAGAEPAAKAPTAPNPAAAPSFAVAVLLVTLPLILSLLGFGAKLLSDLHLLPAWAVQPVLDPATLPAWLRFLGHAPLAWLRFLGHPTMALFVPTALAFVLLGIRRGLTRDRLAKLTGDALQDVGSIVFLFGAAGGFKQVIQDSGAGDYIASQAMQLPLSPVMVAYLVAVLMRAALGSATAAILTASALLASLAKSLPGQETLLVLAVANGVTFLTQPADSGFWMVKEYCNLSVRDVLVRFNICRITMSLTGLMLLLAYEAWRR
jgi:Gnt-I system low-affinity gluconate transporter